MIRIRRPAQHLGGRPVEEVTVVTSTPQAAEEPAEERRDAEAARPTGGGFLLVGVDGSHDPATAIAVGARLMPDRPVRVAHLWASPDAGSVTYRRLAHRAWTNEHLERL